MAGMTDQELLTLCKTSIRLTTTAYDDMIETLIGAAQDDISLSCDVEFNREDKNECTAVVLYVKGQFPFQPDEKSWELYQKRLEVIGTRKTAEVPKMPEFYTNYGTGNLMYTRDTYDYEIDYSTGEIIGERIRRVTP